MCPIMLHWCSHGCRLELLSPECLQARMNNLCFLKGKISAINSAAFCLWLAAPWGCELSRNVESQRILPLWEAVASCCVHLLYSQPTENEQMPISLRSICKQEILSAFMEHWKRWTGKTMQKTMNFEQTLGLQEPETSWDWDFHSVTLFGAQCLSLLLTEGRGFYNQVIKILPTNTKKRITKPQWITKNPAVL